MPNRASRKRSLRLCCIAASAGLQHGNSSTVISSHQHDSSEDVDIVTLGVMQPPLSSQGYSSGSRNTRRGKAASAPLGVTDESPDETLARLLRRTFQSALESVSDDHDDLPVTSLSISSSLVAPVENGNQVAAEERSNADNPTLEEPSNEGGRTPSSPGKGGGNPTTTTSTTPTCTTTSVEEIGKTDGTANKTFHSPSVDSNSSAPQHKEEKYNKREVQADKTASSAKQTEVESLGENNVSAEAKRGDLPEALDEADEATTVAAVAIEGIGNGSATSSESTTDAESLLEDTPPASLVDSSVVEQGVHDATKDVLAVPDEDRLSREGKEESEQPLMVTIAADVGTPVELPKDQKASDISASSTTVSSSGVHLSKDVLNDAHAAQTEDGASLAAFGTVAETVATNEIDSSGGPADKDSVIGDSIADLVAGEERGSPDAGEPSNDANDAVEHIEANVSAEEEARPSDGANILTHNTATNMLDVGPVGTESVIGDGRADLGASEERGSPDTEEPSNNSNDAVKHVEVNARAEGGAEPFDGANILTHNTATNMPDVGSSVSVLEADGAEAAQQAPLTQVAHQAEAAAGRLAEKVSAKGPSTVVKAPAEDISNIMMEERKAGDWFEPHQGSGSGEPFVVKEVVVEKEERVKEEPIADSGVVGVTGLIVEVPTPDAADNGSTSGGRGLESPPRNNAESDWAAELEEGIRLDEGMEVLRQVKPARVNEVPQEIDVAVGVVEGDDGNAGTSVDKPANRSPFATVGAIETQTDSTTELSQVDVSQRELARQDNARDEKAGAYLGGLPLDTDHSKTPLTLTKEGRVLSGEAGMEAESHDAPSTRPVFRFSQPSGFGETVRVGGPQEIPTELLSDNAQGLAFPSIPPTGPLSPTALQGLGMGVDFPARAVSEGSGWWNARLEKWMHATKEIGMRWAKVTGKRGAILAGKWREICKARMIKTWNDVIVPRMELARRRLEMSAMSAWDKVGEHLTDPILTEAL